MQTKKELITKMIEKQAATPEGYIRDESVPKHVMLDLAKKLGLKSTRRLFVAHYFSDMGMHDAFLKETHALGRIKKIQDKRDERRAAGKKARASRKAGAASKPKYVPVPLVLKRKEKPAKPVKAWNLPTPTQTRPAADFVELPKPKKEIDFSRAKWLHCPPPTYTPLNPAKDCALAPARRAVRCNAGEVMA